MSKPNEGRRYWLGVASRDHVKTGVAGGFCQLSHGKSGPLMRIRPGDGIVYYSPRTEMRGGDPVQGFTAIGDDAYRVRIGETGLAAEPLDAA